MNRPHTPLTPDQAAAELQADERDAEAVRRFFGHVLGDRPKPNCSRADSSQRVARKKKARRKSP